MSCEKLITLAKVSADLSLRNVVEIIKWRVDSPKLGQIDKKEKDNAVRIQDIILLRDSSPLSRSQVINRWY